MTRVKNLKIAWLLCVVLITTSCTPSEELPIIASFRGEAIYMSQISERVRGSTTSVSERHALEQIFLEKVTFAEAQARGFYATQKEIDEYMESIRAWYHEEDSEFKQIVNDDLLRRGITAEEYWEWLEKSAPLTIITSKLSEAFFDDFRAQGGDARGVSEAWETFEQELLAKYADDINIYDEGFR